nr:glycosyltransferase family 39 protein [Bacteroidota bacterium]
MKIVWFKRWHHELILIALIIALIFIKIPHLSLPYYGDEGFAFGPAVHLMYQNGPTLLPGGLEPDYSYGHPLMLHFLVSSWMKIFGETIFVAKSFILMVSILLMVSVFIIGSSLFDKDTGLLAVTLLFLQPIFLGLSSFVLPEVLLSFFGMWTLFFFFKKKWLLYAISGSLLVLTKESGLFLIFALCIWQLVDIFIEKEGSYSGRGLFFHYLRILFPAAVFGLFLIIQKMTWGWFFFPLRLHEMRSNPTEISYMLFTIRNIIFFMDGRGWLTIGLLASLVVYYFFSKNFFTLLQWKFIWVAPIFIGIFWALGSFNIVSNRYFFIIITLFVFITATVLVQAFRHNKWLLFPAAFLIIFSQSIDAFHHNRNGDSCLGFVDAETVHLNAVHYMEDNIPRDKRLFTHFLMIYNLKHPVAGYLSEDRIFTNLTIAFNENVDYAVISSVELSPELDSLRRYPHLELMKRFEIGRAWTEIYRNKLKTNK